MEYRGSCMKNEILGQEIAPRTSGKSSYAESIGYLRDVSDLLARLPAPDVDAAVDQLFSAYERGSAVYLFGNGGSAALASHAACDLGKGTMLSGRKPFRVISLCDNVPLMTAWANDSSYEDIFASQLRALIEPQDIVFAISGSGNSPNVLNALRLSRDSRGINVGLTGCGGGRMRDLCDTCVVIPSSQMQQIEDSHVCVMHAIFFGFRERVQHQKEARGASA